jgi:hypothetical protein
MKPREAPLRMTVFMSDDDTIAHDCVSAGDYASPRPFDRIPPEMWNYVLVLSGWNSFIDTDRVKSY